MGQRRALMVRRKLYLETGGLDADFFAHMEEIDFCWRIRNLGWRIVAVCDDPTSSTSVEPLSPKAIRARHTSISATT